MSEKLNKEDSGGKRYNVVNFGFTGIGSFTSKERLRETLNYSKPDRIIIYSGHNDYNNAYRHVIKPRYYLISNNEIFLRVLKFFNFKRDPRVDWFIELSCEPRLIRALQWARLVKIDNNNFDELNQAILSY